MASYRETNDKIELNLTDVRLLVAIKAGAKTGYAAAKQAEKDAGGDYKMSTSLLHRSIKSLEELSMLKRYENGTYKLTRFGWSMLKVKLESLRKLVDLSKKRDSKSDR